jgi:hypothetical protein
MTDAKNATSNPLEPNRTRPRIAGGRGQVRGASASEIANSGALLPAHFSGRTALEIEHAGSGFAIKQWGPFPRY